MDIWIILGLTLFAIIMTLLIGLSIWGIKTLNQLIDLWIKDKEAQGR